jgi:hypothetical protein
VSRVAAAPDIMAHSMPAAAPPRCTAHHAAPRKTVTIWSDPSMTGTLRRYLVPTKASSLDGEI